MSWLPPCQLISRLTVQKNTRLKPLASLATSWPVGLALAGFTWLDEQDAPPHFVSPRASAVFAAYSTAAIAMRPGYLGLASHALNATVQGVKIITSFQQEDAKAALPEGVSRTKVVVLGSGWGAMSFIKNLRETQTGDNGWYDVTLVSPRNYFLYTPLLPGAVTGTVESKSIVESVRTLLRNKGKYFEAQCVDIDPVKKVVRCKYNKPFKGVDQEAEFEVAYDVLVVGVGAINNTFNIPGVQDNCHFLKEMEDAQALRRRVHECLEYAALPSTPPDLRRRLLTFVVVGGGPTGVETAAEIHDMVQDDLRKVMPQTAKEVQIKLVETRDHILSMYDKQISAYTETHFNREGIDLLLNKMVQKVEKHGMHVKNLDGSPEFIEAGTMVWCTGIKLNPLAVSLMNKLPKAEQQNARAIKTDGYLQVKGSQGSIFALGDTATIEQDRLLEHAEQLFKQGDTNQNGLLSCSELRELLKTGSRRYPHLASIENYFSCDTSSFKGLLSSIGKVMSTGAPEAAVVDDTESREFTFEEFKKQLEAIDKTLRALPATAQVANQQGRYLAELFTKYHIQPGELPADAPAFKYKHLGSFAYVGADKAVMEVAVSGDKPGVLTGWLMGWAWKGIESYMQISLKNKYLVSRDWIKAKVFGRDMSDV